MEAKLYGEEFRKTLDDIKMIDADSDLVTSVQNDEHLAAHRIGEKFISSQ